MILLSLIVLALMTVFNSTQNAFRASLTQTDILESGRLAMDLMTDDLRKTTPCNGYYSTNNIQFFATANEPFFTNGPVNFYVTAGPNTKTNQPFIQYLPGTSAQRSNVLEAFYMLSRRNVNGNPSWVGTGYVVDPLSYPTNSLYRFFVTTNMMKGLPMTLFTNFYQAVNFNKGAGLTRAFNPFTNTFIWTHVVDGVVHLTVRPFDPNGLEMTNSIEYRYDGSTNTFYNLNTYFFTPLFPPIPTAALKVYGCYMFSNTVPATVEVNLGVMEDAVLQRVEGMSGPAQLNYLSNHVAQVHLFRQRVVVRSVDPTAYQ
jgi:hypothetical protein